MKTKRKYKQNMKNQVNDMEHSNTRAYWQLVEKTKDAESPIQSSSSVSLTDWVNHYKDLLSDQNDSSEKALYLTDRVNELRSSPFFSELDFKFMNDEIKKVLSKLKYGRAVGIDIVNDEMLKASSPS